MYPDEVAKVQNFLRKKFSNNQIILDMKEQRGDSIEVKMGDEFIGVIYKDTEEGETSYNFNMAILDIDLEDAA